MEGEVRRILKYVLEGTSVTKGILEEIRMLTAIGGHQWPLYPWRESFHLQDDRNNPTHSQKWNTGHSDDTSNGNGKDVGNQRKGEPQN